MSEATQPIPKDLLVVSVGGLGGSRMKLLEARFRQEPRCEVVSAGDWNGWQADLPELVKAHRLKTVAILTHSFAAIPALDFIRDYREMVQYAAFLDPVSCRRGISKYAMPPDHPPYSWFCRTRWGIEQEMTITGVDEPPTFVDCFHNELPSHPDVVGKVVADVLALA